MVIYSHKKDALSSNIINKGQWHTGATMTTAVL